MLSAEKERFRTNNGRVGRTREEIRGSFFVSALMADVVKSFAMGRYSVRVGSVLRFLFFILTFFSFFPASAVELPPKEAGSDFIRLFETGVSPNDSKNFYYTGYGEGENCEEQARAEAVQKLTDKITGMQKIINTPDFTPFLFTRFEKKAGLFGSPPRYWGIYRNKKANIQAQRDRIVSLKILAKKVKKKDKDPDEYIADAKIYHIGKNGSVYIGKTPLVNLPVFKKKEKFVLKKEGFYDADGSCQIDKKKNTCVFLMTPVPPRDDSAGCLLMIVLFVLSALFSKKKK